MQRQQQQQVSVKYRHCEGFADEYNKVRTNRSLNSWPIYSMLLVYGLSSTSTVHQDYYSQTLDPVNLTYEALLLT